MSRKQNRGFKAPKNYDPTKGKKQKRSGFGEPKKPHRGQGGNHRGAGWFDAEYDAGSYRAERRSGRSSERNESHESRERSDSYSGGSSDWTSRGDSGRSSRRGENFRDGRNRGFAASKRSDFRSSRDRQGHGSGGGVAPEAGEYNSYNRDSGARVHMFNDGHRDGGRSRDFGGDKRGFRSDRGERRGGRDEGRFSSRRDRDDRFEGRSERRSERGEARFERRGAGDFRSERRERGGYAGDRRREGYRSNNDSSRGGNFEQKSAGFQPREDIVLDKIEAQMTSAADVANLSFSDLGLGDRICAELHKMGATAPFAIQAATIPDVLAGRDVLGRGRTGSGKTIAFGASLVEKLLQLKAEGAFEADPPQPKRERGRRRGETPGRAPKALIMAPTRELALQIDRTVQPIARSVGLFTTQLVGGAPIERQKQALRRGIDIAIGTPGRIEDLIERGELHTGQVIIAVLDEADHMAELGFIEPVQRIWRSLAPGAQKLLFSATLDTQVAKVVKEFLVDPSVHEVADAQQGNIDHHVLVVMREDKNEVLTDLITHADGPVIMFTRTRAYAETLADLCEDAGVSAVDLHGNLNQSKRERNLKRFAQGRAQVLVATDVAARGIHVDDVALVVQADPPDDYKSYLHRAGRTGRAGSDGTVVTVIPRNRQKRTRQLFDNAQLKPVFFGSFEPGARQPWVVS